MEFAKNIFFFIGSVMGILAFFKPLLEPLLEKNRQRWEKLQQVVTEDDFTNLGYQTWDSRYIKDKNLDRIQRLMHDI
jgi:Zn-dependent oligopeptidase